MLLLTIVLGGLFILWFNRLNRDYYVLALFAKRVKSVDGSPVERIVSNPKGRTIFGNTFDKFGMDSVSTFKLDRTWALQMGKSFMEYRAGFSLYTIMTAEDAELVLTDPNLITKGIAYDFLQPSLHTGLLISTDKKWHSRRKMLTPAFHFNILTQFEEIFKEESQKFVQNLQSQKSNVLLLNELIPKFTLNSVCETALGVRLDERLDGDAYRASFKMIEESFFKRVSNPFFIFEWIFNLFAAHEYKPHYQVVHEFSSGIIKKRRQLFAEKMKNSKNEEIEVDFDLKKKRYAMLDTLIQAEKEGLIDHAGICEEVDTFMFEGFDTTSMGLTFELMNLSLHPEMQERCYQEILDNVDDDLSKLDIFQLNNLKYLECFIKESLRLYPSVPVIMRKAVNEVKLANNLLLPSDTQILINIFDIHRNPKYFPNPDVFDPERFTTEHSVGRHPYAYIPFSAGQRNCIGQKFAMLEMKTLIVYILKHFKLLPMFDTKELKFATGIILRAENNIKVKLIRRR